MVGQPSSNNNNTSSSTSSSSSPCQPVSSSTAMSGGKVHNNNVGGDHHHPQNQAAQPTNRCVWCRENKRQLAYVLPTQHGRKEVCSEMCLIHFKMAYKAGNCTLCSECGCAIRSQDSTRSKLVHNDKEHSFCSNECSEEYKERHGIPPVVQPAAAVPPPPPQTAPHTPGAPHRTLPPATKKKQHDPNVNLSDEFRWSEYLQKTNARAAPSHCFKQHATPPTNEFANDMKLEAIDPRNTTSTCIATVIGSVGPRIRLRLDGSDNSNDFWRSVDSNEIQPIGTCEKNLGMLQPPLGFQKNASFWPMFLCKTLNGAQMAPGNCFKKEPPTPRFNLFKVGHKLEAVDRKNPHLICVATVGAVDRDNIHVTFDGWRGAFDYWCKYDSRDIFPVGWCELAGHPLQPPGNKVQLHTPTTPASALSPQQQQQISNHHHDNPGSPQQQPPIPPYVATLHVSTTCYCGPYLDTIKLKSYPTIIGPSNIQEVYNQFIKMLRECCVRGAPIETLVLLHGSDIHEQGDFWGEVLGLIERFRFCENFVSDKAEDEEDGGSGVGGAGGKGGSGRVRECLKCGGGGGGSAGRNGDERSSLKVAKKRKSSGGGQVVQQQQQQQQHVQRERKGSGGGAGEGHVEPVAKRPVTANNVQQVHAQQAQVPTQPTPPPQQRIVGVGDPGEWNVEQVIGAIVGVDKSMENYADLFRKHEIDGKAMLLLNSDMMMRYMGLKLGPALKICNIINKFKSKNNVRNGSNNGV